jgi:hypothetical protein
VPEWDSRGAAVVLRRSHHQLLLAVIWAGGSCPGGAGQEPIFTSSCAAGESWAS